MSLGFQEVLFFNDALVLQKSFLSNLQSKSSENLHPIHVLVPNYYVAAHLRHLLAQQKALLNVRFVTMPDLAKQSLSSNESFLSKIKLTPEMEIFRIGNIAEKNIARNRTRNCFQQTWLSPKPSQFISSFNRARRQ